MVNCMSKVRKKSGCLENGEIMIEAILVMIPTLFVMIFLLSLGFLLYQQWNIQFIADEVASKVACDYEYADEEIQTGEISLKKAQKTILYKYLFNSDEMEEVNAKKAYTYGTLLSTKTSYGSGAGDETIKLETIEDSLARRHICVTVTGTYRIPFAEGLEIFGIEGTRSISAVSYAECVDLTDYMNTVVFGKQIGDIIFEESKVMKMINSWIGVFSKVFNR